VRIDVSFSWSRINVQHVAECPDVAPAVCAVEGIPIHLHDQTLDVERLGFAVAYGLRPNVSISLALSAARKRTGVDYLTLDGQPFDPPYGDIHHRDGEVLRGIEDPILRLHVGSGERLGRHLLEVEAGASLPLGRTEEDPFRLGLLGSPHQHLQFGTGRVDPRLGVFWAFNAARLRPFAWADARLPLVRNSKGYLQGKSVTAAFGLARTLRRRFAGNLQTGAFHEQPDDWSGSREEGTGRDGAWVSGGVSISVGRGFDLRPDVRWNVWTSGHDEALRQPLVVSLTLGRTLHRPHRHHDGE
jgi:hypothetical protein